MKKLRGSQVYTNSLFRKITYIYATVLLLMGILACRLAYDKTRNAMFNQLDQVMMDLNHEYERITEDFWRRYMPIWTYKESVYEIVNKYFAKNSDGSLSPMDRKELGDALQIVVSSDGRMKWIGVYLGRDKCNYLLFDGETVLVDMSDDFPFVESMENKMPGMEIYGSKIVEHGDKKIRCFALCGRTALNMGDGKIIMGYETANISSDDMRVDEVRDADFYIVNEFGVIYDSTGGYEQEYTLGDPIFSGIGRNKAGEWVYIRELSQSGGTHKVFCVVPWMNMFVNCHSFTPFIVMIVLFFGAFAKVLYHGADNIIMKKIDAIQFGLYKIGANELTYRIPVSDKPADEFEHISQSINEVTELLQENINKAYLSKLRQKEAELSELQAKFDPHFLYNTLEVIRGKVYENGDDETSDIIVKLASIFRSFIGSERFITIQEEMEFCNLYLSLLKYRYDNEVTIIYDVDSEILDYGIIRNLLQPILENYFVHGFCSQKQDNRLTIRGKRKDEDHICFVIKDNGLGITEERLAVLKKKMDTVATEANSSYGLKNVNRRIMLFYGPECGLEIDRNEEGGATIELLIRKLTCKEHEAKMYMEE